MKEQSDYKGRNVPIIRHDFDETDLLKFCLEKLAKLLNETAKVLTYRIWNVRNYESCKGVGPGSCF